MTVYRLLQRVRHLPGLEQADWLWDAVRHPVGRALNLRGRGVPIVVGRSCSVRLPPEYCGADWFNYEPEAVAALRTWVRAHPAGTVVDIGCSLGIMSAVALFSSPDVKVVAVDSDLSSLRACERLCAHAKSGRLSVLHGLIADEHQSRMRIDQAVESTAIALMAAGVTGDVNTTTYRCLADPDTDLLPVHSLDGLWDAALTEDGTHRDILVKCDVEGAELLVLRGGRRLLAIQRPSLLVSVHPPALPAYGHHPDQIRELLTEAGYAIELLAIDHEEHWWCTPRAAMSAHRQGEDRGPGRASGNA